LITKEEHKKIHSLHKIPKTPEKKIKFICKVCGKEYESVNRGKDFSAHSNGSQKFCSEDCFYKFRQKREEKICPTCGKKFLTQPSKNKKYCSRSCYFKSKKLYDKII